MGKRKEIIQESIRGAWNDKRYKSFEDFLNDVANIIISALDGYALGQAGELTEEEICKNSGCAFANNIISEKCPYGDKRGCPLFVSGKLGAQKLLVKFQAIHEAEIEREKKKSYENGLEDGMRLGKVRERVTTFKLIKRFEKYLREVIDANPKQLQVWQVLKANISIPKRPDNSELKHE
jgi:hypothetical protein